MTPTNDKSGKTDAGFTKITSNLTGSTEREETTTPEKDATRTTGGSTKTDAG